MTTGTAAQLDDSLAGWSIGLAEEVDIPGWLYVPPDLDPTAQHVWVSEATAALVDLIESRGPLPDGSPGASADDVSELLQAALVARAQSECELMYQVWPVAGPAALTCEVTATRTDELPEWTTMPGRVHLAHARYIGPGIQYSTRRDVEIDDGVVELSSVHFVFADPAYAILVSLRDAPSPLIASGLVPLATFKDALAVTQDDGELFVSTPFRGLIEDAAWDLDDKEVS